MFAKKRNKLLADKAVVSDFDGMPQGAGLLHAKPASIIEALIMTAREFRRLLVSAREDRKETLQPRRIALELCRKLPQDWPQLFLQPQHPLREKVGQRDFHVAQLQHVGDK